MLRPSRRCGSLLAIAVRGLRTSALAGDKAAELQDAAVQLSHTAPVLLQLQERTWGARHRIPASAIPESVQEAPRIGIVRDAYVMYNQKPRPLSTAVASLADGRAAVLSDLADNEHRMVVDEYVHDEDSGEYMLQNVSTDLLRLLRREHVRMAFVPDVANAAAYNSAKALERGAAQSTNEILMVAPTAFGFNDETAEDNSFMHEQLSGSGGSTAPGTEVTHQVLQEFSGLYQELTDVAGVRVNLFCHSLVHGTPDAVFPNNWFSTHPAAEASGALQRSTLVLYPMKASSRRQERRDQIIAVLQSRGYGHLFDMSYAERAGHYLEGTGSLVLDRVNGVAYAAISDRTAEDLLKQWVHEMGYKELVTFRSRDSRGKCVYHTNVCMAIGSDVAVICGESLASDAQRQHVLGKLRRYHKVIDISQAQMDAMCGNIVELQDHRGLPVMAMSSRAHQAFEPEQRRELLRHAARLHHAPIPTIEHVGGGSVRCSIAELF